MNKKRIKSYLSTGVIIGFLIDFILMLIIGVSEKKIDNYIYLGICLSIPTLVTILLINIELYKNLRITKKRFILSIVISSTISFILGFLIELFIVEVLSVKVWNKERILYASYKSLVGVIFGVIISNYVVNIVTKRIDIHNKTK